MTRFILSFVLGTVLVLASAANAVPPLSADHTAYGVSQLWAGHANDDDRVVMRLRNPNRVAHAAAFLVYDRVNESQGEGDAEVFRSCGLRVLTSHASIGISPADFAFIGVSDRRYYAEVIAVPLSTVSAGGAQTRIADSLGIVVGGGGSHENRNWTAVNPALFNLPDDKAVAGQAQDAVNCVCFQLAIEELPPDLFSGFGIQCS